MPRKEPKRLVAAAYARFSSDAQRDESIEIQLRAIDAVIEREGWTRGRSYCDHAMSGRTDRRPEFRRCIDDGVAGEYDVLVIYKLDRLARNVTVSQQAKRRLFDAGRRLVSVREGEITDTPDGFLMSGVGDLFAEYYSRNLAVLVRGGIDQAALDLRAAGRRIYGYDVDETDHFVINESQADFVRGMFSRFLAGQTMGQIADWLNGSGSRTIRGNRWGTPALCQLMKNVAYKGVYRFAGHEVEGGMPAIVSADDFDRVQEMRVTRHERKRRFVVNSYLLTDKAYCARCGRPMCGTAGTSATGRKYTYYGCVLRGGCGLRVSSSAVEDAVVGSVAALLSDERTREEIVSDMMEYARSLPDHSAEFEEELRDCERRRDNLVRAIADGVPAKSVSKAIADAETRIDELGAIIESERAARDRLPDEERVRSFLDSFMGDESDPDYREAIVRSFVDRVYVDKGMVAVTFNMGEPEEVTLDAVAELFETQRKTRTSGTRLVRVKKVWWTPVSMLRTHGHGLSLYRNGLIFAIVGEAA